MRLPGERALADFYAVGLATMRRALDVRTERGLLRTWGDQATASRSPASVVVPGQDPVTDAGDAWLGGLSRPALVARPP